MKKLIFFFFFGAYVSLQGQLLELDSNSPVQRESLFKVKLFKQFMGGINTLGHVDLSNEVININYSGSGGFIGGISVVGTFTLFSGNKDDKKNNLSHLLNPLGGSSGSFYFQFPLKEKEKSSLRINSRMGLKLIQGMPLRGFERSFISNYGMLGGVYQRLLFEDAPENQRIDFWIYPHLMASQMGKNDIELFFDNGLETLSYGHGLQTGVEFNQKIRLIFLVNQLVNTLNPETLGIPVLRFTLAYHL